MGKVAMSTPTGSVGLLAPVVDLESELPRELVWLADKVDAAVGGWEHSAAVARWAARIAARLGLDRQAQVRTAAAARVHDVGKISIAQSLLAKPGRLTEQEWEQMRRHPEEGARLLVELANRPDLAPLVAAHHERYDGDGYPRGLAGDDIPIGARIISVCDAWAAMRVDRPYARALEVTKARDELESGRGTQFDAAVVDAFLGLADEGAIDDPALVPDIRQPTSHGACRCRSAGQKQRDW